MNLSMIDWEFLQENYPDAVREYMRKSWELEDFWNAYNVYVRCKLIEYETGCEMWDWKISSKLVMYSSICYKTIIRDGKRIQVYSFTETLGNQLDRIFKIIDQQIKDKNYLNN